MAFPTIPYLTIITPKSGIQVERSDGGTLRGQDLAGTDTYLVVVRWNVITAAQLATIRADWAASRGDTVTVNGHDGETYTGIWMNEPTVKRNGGYFSAETSIEGTRD